MDYFRWVGAKWTWSASISGLQAAAGQQKAAGSKQRRQQAAQATHNRRQQAADSRHRRQHAAGNRQR